jgi:hypothetical protein
MARINRPQVGQSVTLLNKKGLPTGTTRIAPKKNPLGMTLAQIEAQKYVIDDGKRVLVRDYLRRQREADARARGKNAVRE